VDPTSTEGKPARVSATIMAHPKRADWAESLADELGCGITWDRRNNVWDTARRSWKAADPTATHHLVVQDDARVCRDLMEAATVAAQAAGDRPVSFTAIDYKLQSERDGYLAALAAGECFYPIRRGLSTVSLMVPTRLITQMLRQCSTMSSPHDDVRIAQFFRLRRQVMLLSVPSLVDHRNPAHSPSLVGNGGTRARRDVIRFIGENRSGLAVNFVPWGPRGAA
jgi:hypothetical protein